MKERRRRSREKMSTVIFTLFIHNSWSLIFVISKCEYENKSNLFCSDRSLIEKMCNFRFKPCAQNDLQSWKMEANTEHTNVVVLTNAGKRLRKTVTDFYIDSNFERAKRMPEQRSRLHCLLCLLCIFDDVSSVWVEVDLSGRSFYISVRRQLKKTNARRFIWRVHHDADADAICVF